jgi:hypothetical protein
MTTVAIVVGVYLLFVCFVLSILTVAKRADKSAELTARERGAARAGPGHGTGRVYVLPDHEQLGEFVAQVSDQLQADQVTVIVGDEDSNSTGLGIVGACLGPPGMLGTRLSLVPHAQTGVVTSLAERRAASGEGIPTAYIRLPLEGTDGIVGAITIAAPRSEGFTHSELKRVERLARHGAPEFERRQRPRKTA